MEAELSWLELLVMKGERLSSFWERERLGWFLKAFLLINSRREETLFSFWIGFSCFSGERVGEI